MFDNEYLFRGSHAEKVSKLTAKLDELIGRGVFKTNYDVYILAPIVGFLYNKSVTAEKDNFTTKVFADKIQKGKKNLVANFQMLTLIQMKKEQTIEESCDLLFRYIDMGKDLDEDGKEADTDKNKKIDIIDEYYKKYDDYVRGGVEVIYEKIFGTGNSTEDYIKNLYMFIDEVNERYYANGMDEVM